LEYLIKQYPLDSGALEIQYIEEYFGEFPRKKTAREIINRLSSREFLILMAEAPLPEDPGMVVPVAYKIVHELRANENEPKLVDLVGRLSDCVKFEGRKVLYSWIGGTRRDWRGQGHFRALTEESEAWAHASGACLGISRSGRQDEEPLLRHARHARPAGVRCHQVRGQLRRQSRVEGLPQ
jgi:hypothetical protein